MPADEVETALDNRLNDRPCVCFGGRDYRTMFITSARKFLDAWQLSGEPKAGHLLAIHGLAQGLAEHPFG